MKSRRKYISLILAIIIVAGIFLLQPAPPIDNTERRTRDSIELHVMGLQETIERYDRDAIEDELRSKKTIDSLTTLILERDEQINRLQRKIHNVDFRGYSDAQLDSVVRQLYGHN